MNIEKGTVCPLCGKPLTENDDIVVCPDCGTPHHRACWKAHGQCGCPEHHTTAHETCSEPAAPETSEIPEIPEVQKPEVQVCFYCRTDNDPDARFCHHCGHPLSPAPDMPGVRLIFDPLGGVKPDAQIDGVSAKDLADVVGPRSSYYLPIFQRIAKKQRPLPLNLSALFFDMQWLFIRKMYLPAIGITLLELALAAPSIWGFVVTFIAGEALNFSSSFWLLYDACRFLKWVPRIALALFGNTLYQSHCVAKVQSLRQKYPDDAEFRTKARSQGGTSRFFTIVTTTLTVMYFIFTAWTTFAT
ncbi:MAG: zinc-ribbon domain-containing protein [Clostridia bacterium]|nr:zinc-ribbon domain-containing protein [Clostridia bacterium]